MAPSSRNCTDDTPAAALAVALTAIVPDIVAPDAGEVIDTVAGGVLVLFTVIETLALAWWFDVSVAVAVRTCEPLLALVVSHDAE